MLGFPDLEELFEAGGFARTGRSNQHVDGTAARRDVLDRVRLVVRKNALFLARWGRDELVDNLLVDASTVVSSACLQEAFFRVPDLAGGEKVPCCLLYTSRCV